MVTRDRDKRLHRDIT